MSLLSSLVYILDHLVILLFFFLQLRVMFYLVIKTKDLSQEHSLRAGKIQGKDIEDMEEFLQQRPDSQT